MENFKVMRAWDSKYGYIKYIYKDNGKKQIGKVKFEWWFYIKTSDYRKRKGIFEHLINEKLINKTEQEGLYTRIYVDYNHSNDFLDIDNEMVWEYKTYKFYQVKKTLEQANIQTYEADVLPYKRWLLQNNVEIETEYKVLYYDIETDDRHGKIEIGRDRILSIALLDEQTGKEKFLYLKEFTDEAERALLKKLARILNAYDVIVGWNSNKFDDLYIKARFARYGIRIDWRRLFLIDQCKIFITDGPKLSRYNLNTVANYILNESKVEHSESIYELWKYNKKKLKEYNLQDVRLLYKIEKKTLLLKNNRFINIVGKCSVDDYFITRKIDNMLLMRVQERKHYHFKTKTKDDVNHGKFKGAYVFNPITGYYEKINVVDFLSLYPNIINTFNISPDTYIEPSDMNKYNKKDLIKCINGAYYRKDIIGIMPEVIMHVQDKRNFYKAKLKEYDKGTPEYEIYNALQYVYKKFGLSFYGAIGEVHTRFYNVKIAESVTQMGVYFNKTCSEYCKKKGFKTVYGDSVTEDRCTVIKHNGIIKIVSFKELYDMTDIKYKSRGKEFGIFTKSIKTLSYNFKERKEEWQQIIRVIKHKTNKKIYAYRIRNAMTKITQDHSLIDKNGKEFKPLDKDKNAFIINNITNENLDIVDLSCFIKNYTYTRKRGRDIHLTYNNDYIYLDYNTRRNIIKVKRFYKTEQEIKSLLKVIAHYICNGSSSTKETTKSNICKYNATISSNDIELLNELKYILDNMFNYKHKIIKSNGKNYKIQMPTVFHAIFWKQLAGQLCWYKYIPDFIYNLPNKFKRYFINELIKGDGSFYKTSYGYKIEFETGSVKLLSGISYIFNDLNIKHSIKWNENDNTYTIREYKNENYGKHLYKKVIKEIDYNGYVYDLEVNANHNFIDVMGNMLLHNTDSLFLENLPINKMNSLLKNIEKLCKLHAVKKFNSNNCSLKMDYDKGFKNIIILAKKRYAGIITYLDSHVLDKPLLYVAGLEYKRTDGCNYLRKIQKELIEKILLPDKLPSITEIYQYLIDKKSKLFNREVTLEDITLSQKLTKEIDEYDGRRLNVIVAKEMINDGKEIYVGNKIPYFIESINEKKQPVPKPIYKYKGNFHAIYYWNKTIYPALERILSAVYPDFEWKQLYSKNAKTNIRSNSTSLW